MGNNFTFPIDVDPNISSRKAIKRKALDQALDQLQYNFKKKKHSNKGVIAYSDELIKCVHCIEEIRIDLMEKHLLIHVEYCDICNNYVLKSKIKTHMKEHDAGIHLLIQDL